MVKIIIGLKGSGKTKTLISMVNDAAHASHGNVVCIEKGKKLIYDVKYKARLIEADAYNIDDAHSLFGFVSGIAASDHDLSDVFIDSALKICNDDVDAFAEFVEFINEVSTKIGFNCVMTSSISLENIPEQIKKFI